MKSDPINISKIDLYKIQWSYKWCPAKCKECWFRKFISTGKNGNIKCRWCKKVFNCLN